MSMLAKKSKPAVLQNLSKPNKNNGKPSKIIQLVHSITESEIHSFRNSKFDNMAVKLITSGHRQSYEFLEQIVEKSLKEEGEDHQENSSLLENEEKLVCLKNYFTKAEDYCRDGRFNQVSQAYCEAATCEAVAGMYWLQELIMEKALSAAEKFKADGGRSLAYCQLQLANMLEASKVRKLKRMNIIYGNDYRVNPPKRCISLLEGCLEASIERFKNQKARPFYFLSFCIFFKLFYWSESMAFKLSTIRIHLLGKFGQTFISRKSEFRKQSQKGYQTSRPSGMQLARVLRQLLLR